eukprot:gene13254-14618_t
MLYVVVLSKIIEKAVHRQVMGFLEVNKLLSKFQFGFRPKLSTELAATLLFDEIRQHVDEGKLVGATFIDLSKAFDTISHSNLLQKLPQCRICDEELGWFTDYLFHRSVVVSYGSYVIEVAKIVKYADDTVIYVADKDITFINSKLTKDMDPIAKWLDQNALIINLKKGKTESLLFGTSQRIAKQNETLSVMYRSDKLPKIKPEYARKSFRFMGAKTYNELPLDIRKTESFNAYEQHFKQHFT